VLSFRASWNGTLLLLTSSTPKIKENVSSVVFQEENNLNMILIVKKAIWQQKSPFSVI
jgi:hypothetical protein